MPANKNQNGSGKRLGARFSGAADGNSIIFEHFTIGGKDTIDRLCGDNDQLIAEVSRTTGVDISRNKDGLQLNGPAKSLTRAKALLNTHLDLMQDGSGMAAADAASLMTQQIVNQNLAYIQTPEKKIETRNPVQARLVRAMIKHDISFGIGPAGTGKTYLAVAAGVEALVKRTVKQLILTRPAVEAGERIGFLPGTMKDKVDPYMRPIYDALHEMLGKEETDKKIEEGAIEIAPLGFMRGQTLKNAFVILDEAQNTTPEQMKMFVTRIGEGTRAVITGDPTQNDLPADPQTKERQLSGLVDLLEVLEHDTKTARVYFTKEDVVRSPIVAHVVGLYEARDEARQHVRIAETAASRGSPASSASTPAPRPN